MKKKYYISPRVELILLDHEISLQLESSPPVPDGESSMLTPDYFNNDPFQNQKV